LAIALWTSQGSSAQVGPLRVTFIDVGQGDAAWLKTPDGFDILIDGGEEEKGPGLVSYLRAHGVTDIEVLVLTHPHSDHVGGLVEVLDEMEVDEALTNCQPHTTIIYGKFVDGLAASGAPTACVRYGDTFAWGSYISVTALNPAEPLFPGDSSKALNNNSVALRVSYGDVDFLLTGDIESEAENAILGRGATVEAEVLKVAHHGSDSSSKEPFLAEVDPDIAIISVGAGNPHGHPDQATIDNLTDVGAIIRRTDEDGTVTILTDGVTWWELELTYVYLPLVLKGWSAVAPGVRVDPDCCQVAPTDGALNDEYVCFTNGGVSSQDMTDWEVQDEVAHTYTFPAFTLGPGSTVKLHTGSGSNTATDLYWNRGSWVWNNDHDTVYLYDNAESLVDSYSY
jgi:competence protein ComEC